MLDPASFDALKTAHLFSGYTERDLAEISRFAKPVHIEAHDVLFRESEPCSAIYCLAEGLIKLCLYGPKRQEKIVEIIGTGQTFAEAAMFSGQGYPVSAVAIEDSRLVAVDAYSFMRYLRQRPDLNWTMLAMLSRRLHQLVGQVKSMSLHSAEQKVAKYLMEYYDVDSPDRPVGNLPPRRADLAAVLGITAETLCRIIANFRKRGGISTADNAIVIVEPAAMLGLLQITKTPDKRTSLSRNIRLGNIRPQSAAG